MDGRLHFFSLLTNINDDKHTWERPAQAFELAKVLESSSPVNKQEISCYSHHSSQNDAPLLSSAVACWVSGFGFLTWGSKDNCDCNRHCINPVELNHPTATPTYHKLSNISERVSIAWEDVGLFAFLIIYALKRFGTLMLQGLWLHSRPKSQHHKDPLGASWQEVFFIGQVPRTLCLFHLHHEETDIPLNYICCAYKCFLFVHFRRILAEIWD